MKNIKYTLLASLLAVTIVTADTNSTFDGETPPSPDYSLITGSSCDGMATQAEVAAAIAAAKASCMINPASCGITNTLSQNQLDAAVTMAIEEQKANCLANPASCGISTGLTQTELDAVVLAAQIEQKASCLANPTSCGINVDNLITQVDIPSLSVGWHLLGTSVDINSTALFDAVHIVWTYKDGRWSAYSSDLATETLIVNDNNITPLSNISANSGYWILKQ